MDREAPLRPADAGGRVIFRPKPVRLPPALID
jgi:hypothetical protein